MSTEYTDHQALIAELRGFKTLGELQESAAYRRHREYLADLLEQPRLFPVPEARPRIRDFVRLAHWNIEKGRYLDEIIEVFRRHPILREADLISLNEADVGMNRSGQRFIARELGAALGMHCLFAPAYLEFSKGYGEDLKIPGENTIALQGNAILSRYELRNPRILKLPVCFDHFAHQEQRIGARQAVAAEISVGGGTLAFASTHLEVRNKPGCRARQIQALVEALHGQEAAVIAGDFNTNATPRGGWWRTLRAALRLSFADKDRLTHLFANPQLQEPLFDVLRRHGFTEQGFNCPATTCIVPMRGFEDRSALPRFLADAFESRMARFDYHLDFRLDWIVGRRVRPLGQDEIVDSVSGQASRRPQSIPGLKNGQGGQISDHDPIAADLMLA
ncbi:MAG TPA: endonuclease/exonuclease/phosphatase family protein [Blastocatellia bacterium]|nr:endonuclease/exonuclease/phosphatase family protein [Blastocatellia bacterium]